MSIVYTPLEAGDWRPFWRLGHGVFLGSFGASPCHSYWRCPLREGVRRCRLQRGARAWRLVDSVFRWALCTSLERERERRKASRTPRRLLGRPFPRISVRVHTTC